MPFCRIAFESLRRLLVLTTGHGYDRSPWLNNLHHKLAFRLHKLLPAFGITGIQRVPVPGMPEHFMYVRAEDGGVAHHLIVYRQYEPLESQLVRNAVKPGMVVYNIGANLGYYSLLASHCVGPTGKIYAFEPEPGNLELLRRTISENHCTNVSIYSEAVSKHSEVATLSISATNSGDHRLTDVAGRNQMQVPTISLDNFIAENNPVPNVIIMDVQGSELDVLSGATQLLLSRQPLVLFTEFWPEGLNARRPNGAKEFLELLRNNGFELTHIDERHRNIRNVSTEWVLNNVTGTMEANLLARRS